MVIYVQSWQNFRIKKELFFITCVFAIVSYVFLHGISRNRKTVITYFYHNDQVKSREVKKILLWTKFFTNNVTEDHRSCLSQCDAKCEVTDNKAEVISADAVIFNLVDLWKENWNIGTKEIVDLPTYRHQAQVWVLWNTEPPVNLFGNLGVLNRLFNWTMFYRSDSTIWLPYGAAAKLNNTENLQAREMMKERNVFREKKADVVGRISNCRDEGRRYKAVHELQKYLHVYMFGGCYNNSCVSNNACEDALKKYNFYLAFKNSQCTDYVTEKYWGSLQRDQIPIVNWKVVNSNIPIPGSYINIFDFKSTKDAAAYIQRVGNNETLYNSYFNWKLKYKNYIACPDCRLCRALHDNSRPAQVYTNLEAWIQEDSCEQVGRFNFNWRQLKWRLYWIFKI